MSDVDAALAEVHSAVEELLIAAERCGTVWTTPRAPGKWSPSQVVEHVARAFEESANVAAGRPHQFPTLPRMVRPVLRSVFFNRVLKRGTFPSGRTNKAMNPASGPRSPADARIRLDGAVAKFDAASRQLAAEGKTLATPVFGVVSVADYARFQALHTRHHTRQMPRG